MIRNLVFGTIQVHLTSQFILNGVCVRWKGWLDMETLTGVGCVEFDSERAEVHNNVLNHQPDYFLIL